MKKGIAVVLVASLLSGCAVSRSRFIEERFNLSDLDTCRVYLRDRDKLASSYNPKDYDEGTYLSHLQYQVDRRDLTYYKCNKLVSEDNQENLMIGAAVLGAIAVGVAASRAGGGGANYQQQGYAWDAFYGSGYNMLWRCRNKANGQFADDSYCRYKTKLDNTWPQK